MLFFSLLFFFSNGFMLIKPLLKRKSREKQQWEEQRILVPLQGFLDNFLPMAPSHSLSETTRDTSGEVPGLEKLATKASSSIDPKLINRQLANPLVVDSHRETPSHEHELVDERPINEPNLMHPQHSLGEIEIPQGTKNVKEPGDQGAQEGNISKKKSVEEHSTSKNTEIVASSLYSEPASSLSGPFKPNINLQDYVDDDLISLFQSMEEDNGGESPIPDVSIVATTNDDLVAKALADLEDYLRMPLKDIASSESNTLRLRTALNFLSRLSLEYGALTHELKAIIQSLRQGLPSILHSYNQAFTTLNKFAVLEERDKCMKKELGLKEEAAFAIVSKMSKAKKFFDEAQKKEAKLREQMCRLEKEIQDCEDELSSLQEQKKKCVAEIVEVKKKFESVRKEKFEMAEHQRKARQQLFEVDFKWSILCSQFEHNFAARDLS